MEARMAERRRIWTVFSNHGMVLFYVAANPSATLRVISDALGITERQVARIVKDLAEAGMIAVERRGARNAYTVNPEAHLRHPTLAHVPLGPIMAALLSASKPTDGTEEGRAAD
ncbi:MAG: winged helix-turn-helix domain-containing protein [Chloroflexota bacterium]|nr:winged helix-turn-helix domain-containing protein [Chloroflexota bacterium]